MYKKLLIKKQLFQFQHYKNYSKSIKINQYKINDIINNITLTFNNISGVENLDKLKKIVSYNEKNAIVQKEMLRSLRNEYEENVLKRHVCQAEINSLLQRKNSWTKDDLSYYTTLITSEHNLASTEEVSKNYI
jgi:sensitive to high expression protein 9